LYVFHTNNIHIKKIQYPYPEHLVEVHGVVLEASAQRVDAVGLRSVRNAANNPLGISITNKGWCGSCYG
jgi:hypothetical protein